MFPSQDNGFATNTDISQDGQKIEFFENYIFQEENIFSRRNFYDILKIMKPTYENDFRSKFLIHKGKLLLDLFEFLSTRVAFSPLVTLVKNSAFYIVSSYCSGDRSRNHDFDKN